MRGKKICVLLTEHILVFGSPQHAKQGRIAECETQIQILGEQADIGKMVEQTKGTQLRLDRKRSMPSNTHLAIMPDYEKSITELMFTMPVTTGQLSQPRKRRPWCMVLQSCSAGPLVISAATQ
jgi:hypothetical protein